MFDSNLKPVGLYVEQGRELVHASTKSGWGNFHMKPKIGTVRAPVLVVHGENDTIVPISLGQRLYDLVRMPKRFVRVAGAEHNDLGVYAVSAAKRFIAEQPAL